MPTDQPAKPGAASRWLSADQDAYAEAARVAREQALAADERPYPQRRRMWRRARARRLRVG